MPAESACRAGRPPSALRLLPPLIAAAPLLLAAAPQEEETPKGNSLRVELDVTLKDLYLGAHFKARRRPLSPARPVLAPLCLPPFLPPAACGRGPRRQGRQPSAACLPSAHTPLE